MDKFELELVGMGTDAAGMGTDPAEMGMILSLRGGDELLSLCYILLLSQ